MKTLTVPKSKLQEYVTEFINQIDSEQVKIDYDENHLVIHKNDEEKSVLDRLIEEAEELGPEDLSINVDRYLYGSPRRKEGCVISSSILRTRRKEFTESRGVFGHGCARILRRFGVHASACLAA